MTTIKYNIDETHTNLKTIVFIGFVILMILFVILYPFLETLAFSIVSIIVLRHIISRPDGEFQIIEKMESHL